MTKDRIALIVVVALLQMPHVVRAQNFRIFDPAPGLLQKAPHAPPPFMHWDLREMPACRVPWVMGTAPVIDLNNNFIPDEPADRAIFNGILTSAFARWDAVLPSDLGLINTGAGAPVGGYLVDDYNTMIFDTTSLPTGTLAAVVITRNATSGRVQECDIVFNSNFTPTPYYGVHRFVQQPHASPAAADVDYPPYFNWPTPADGDTDIDGDFVQEWNVDLLTLALHETGHFIGIAHMDPLGGAGNNPANSVMEQYWFMPLGPLGGGWANQTLKDHDRDAENFLYTPDLGDAPDPWMGVVGQYPTLVHQPGAGRTLNGVTLDGIRYGAEHILGIKTRQPARNWTYEWLGYSDNSNVDSECEANVIDLDSFDDGVTFYPNPPVWGRTLTVTAWARYANDNVGSFHDYQTYGLWANSWIDLNQDGFWEFTPPEWFMFNVLTPFPLVGANAVGVEPTTAGVFLPYPPFPDKPVWLRTRLDYGENVSINGNVDGTLNRSEGAAQFGEVEDYPLWCTRRYETHWADLNAPLQNVRGIRDVYVGPPEGGDLLYGAEVNAGDCVVQVVPPGDQYTAFANDETTHDWVLPDVFWVGRWMHVGKCRSTPNGNLTLARSYWLSTDFNAPGTPAPPAFVIPPQYRIPSVNVGHCLVGPGGSPTGMLVIIGALDGGSGGWIDPDTQGASTLASSPPDGWSDTLSVSVSYRVTNGVLPLQNLSPCDPTYASLPQTLVGTGQVTPEGGMQFPLSIPGALAPGQSLIVEVVTSWGTNGTVNRQIVELPLPAGSSTPVDDPSLPKRYALESYPNPFNPATTIRFALPKGDVVSLAVYDVSGRLVRALLSNARKPAGFFEAEWNGTDANGRQVASGVYFFRLTTSTESLTRKAVLLK